MQSYVVNYLIGFLAVMATCHSAFGRSSSFFRTLEETAAEVAQIPIADNSIDAVDAFPIAKTHVETKPVGKTNRKPRQQFVRVVLDDTKDQSITIEEGKSYVLTCTIMVNSSAVVYWYGKQGPNEEISLPAKSSGINENRVVMAKEKYVIDCATKKDEGDIHCVAITGNGVAHRSAFINVVDSTSAIDSCNSISAPVITSHIQTIFSAIGSTITLKCRAQGFPRPETRWITENGDLIANGHFNSRYVILETGDLVIENLEWADMGLINCIATSDYGMDKAGSFVYPTRNTN